jgi:hypothetical protein
LDLSLGDTILEKDGDVSTEKDRTPEDDNADGRPLCEREVRRKTESAIRLDSGAGDARGRILLVGRIRRPPVARKAAMVK